jgi:membrane protease YdiL (CAAX protease family)
VPPIDNPRHPARQVGGGAISISLDAASITGQASCNWESFMGEIQPQASASIEMRPRYCGYCGAPLDVRFYFCTRCAMPFTSPSDVIPAPAPMPLFEGELIRRKAPYVWPMFWTFFAVIVGLLVAGHIASRLGATEERSDVMLLVGSIILAIVTLIFASIHWRSLVPQLRNVGFLSPAAYAAIGILAPLLLVNWGYHNLIIKALEFDGIHVTESMRSHFSAGTLIVLYCIFPAVTEEIAFRGLLQHWLSAAIRPQRAMLLASALFAAVHFALLSAPYLFLVGMLLGWAKWKTGSLYPSMAIHFLHNFVAVMWL